MILQRYNVSSHSAVGADPDAVAAAATVSNNQGSAHDADADRRLLSVS